MECFVCILNIITDIAKNWLCSIDDSKLMQFLICFCELNSFGTGLSLTG